MNAITTFNSSDPLDAFCPWIVDDRERELRKRLLTARDLASAKVTRVASDHARSILWMVIDLAAPMVFAPASIERLDDMSMQCRRLLVCASSAERLEDDHVES